MISILSNQNPIIKEIKALKVKKHREEKRLYFIEGIRFVEEALKEKAEINYILISEKLAESKEDKEILDMVVSKGCKTYLLPDKLFKEASDTDNPQGIMAVLRMKGNDLEEIINEDKNFIVILDAIQDPGNMGTIIRTADAAGANGIIMSKGCVDMYNPKVLRSTMGSVFRLPVHFSDNLIEDIKMIKASGTKIYAAHLMGDKSYFEVNNWNNTAIIIGNEANGISEEVARFADTLVKIPMVGRTESLNASVAAGLLIYEVLRSRLNN